MVIKILGAGCANCKRLKHMAIKIVQELGIEAKVVEVNDIPAIMSYGISATPGLVIDERLIGYGGVPSKRQLTQLIQQATV
jgi:small redox-active disulfide protein 2